MKIFLAGTNAEIKHKDILKTSPYLLESFYYYKPWQDEIRETCKAFMLDSGAFTFFSNGKELDWNDYLKMYAEFIVSNDIELFYELDIDDIVGYENVLKMREKLETLTNRRPIPVWHINRGKDEYINMCKQYDYVAIGGLVGVERRSKRQQSLEKNFPWFIKTAHANGAKVHALGFTKVQMLEQYHFDSVDSTRWNCARFGRVEYFDGKTIRSIDRRKDGKRLVDKTQGRDIIKITLEEWVKYQKYAETHL